MTDYESTHPNFPLTVELHKLRFKPDPPKEPKGIWKWVQGGFVGLLAGLVVCVISESGKYFLPVFAVVTLGRGLGRKSG